MSKTRRPGQTACVGSPDSVIYPYFLSLYLPVAKQKAHHNQLTEEENDPSRFIHELAEMWEQGKNNQQLHYKLIQGWP